MSGEALFTQADLEFRVGKTSIARIFDDDGTGIATSGPIARLVADGSSTTWAYLPVGYELPDDPLTVGVKLVPEYLRKLALDVAQATAYIRHPEFNRTDGHEMLKTAKLDLKLFKHEGTTDIKVPRTDEYGAVVSNHTSDRAWLRTR
jgi:hypothetical protein